jgi:hypothetical protein
VQVVLDPVLLVEARPRFGCFGPQVGELIRRYVARVLPTLMLVGCSAAPTSSEVGPTPNAIVSTAGSRAAIATPGQPTQPVRTCTRVHGPLQTVAEAADPGATARIAHLRLVDSMLEASLIAMPGTAWGNIVQEYGLRQLDTGTPGELMSVLVPPEALCDLSKDPRVNAVNPLERPTPATGG